MSYVKGDRPLASLKSLDLEDWSPIHDCLYAGLNNGVYWIRMDGLGKSAPCIVSIPESHVTHATLFTDSGLKLSPIPKTRKISFELDTMCPQAVLYLRVEFRKEAILSIQAIPRSAHEHQKSLEDTYLGMYYGGAAIVILLNLFSFLNHRRKAHLYYSAMLMAITLGLAAADGYVRLLFESENLQVYAEPFFNLCVALALPVLANRYMHLDRHLPRINLIGILLGLLSIGLFVGYVLSGAFIVFAVTQATSLALVTAYWVAGAMLFGKTLEARIFTIGYLVICFSCYDFYIARSFGFSFLGLTLDQFRVGAIIEMVVFTWAISYQGRLLSIENQKMRNQLLRYTHGDEGKALLELEISAKLTRQYGLTPKEIQILRGISEDKINKEIGAELNISVNTVKFHVKRTYQKLQVSSRQEARQKYFSSVEFN